jgi:hypothetical protein
MNKKNAINLLGSQLDKDKESEDLIKNYLPENKTEEQIINGLNYMATAANVFLINISLADVINTPKATDLNTAQTISTAVNTSKGDISGATPAAEQTLPVSPPNLVDYAETSVSVSGDYNSINMFLDEVQSLPLFNSIKTLDISSQKDNTGANAAGKLLAKIVVDFGYLKSSAVDNQKILSFKPVLDNDTIAALKQYVSQKTPALATDDPNKGKTNPFTP